MNEYRFVKAIYCVKLWLTEDLKAKGRDKKFLLHLTKNHINERNKCGNIKMKKFINICLFYYDSIWTLKLSPILK